MKTSQGTPKSKPRILKVWIEKRVDEDPDLSCIGEWTDDLKPGVIVRDLGEFYERLPAPMDRDVDGKFYRKGAPEVPARGREYRGFIPYAGGEKVGTPEFYKYGLQDWKRMEDLNQGDWCMLGIIAKAEVQSRAGEAWAPIQTLRSGGLWGVESDAGEYLAEVGKEELANLRDELKAWGFGDRAIDYAFQSVEEVGP
jgi:hypothetical protein